tara:strand:- start:1520 stop:2236 length:717 start_codon:yes stop_codon:yes gene_type:complete
MKTICITQARTGSTRLPSKVLKKINDTSILEIHLNRIKRSKKIDKLIVATSEETEDDKIFHLVENQNIECYRGDEEDVLDRYYQAAKKHKPEFIVRLTSDCPLIDPNLIDEIIENAVKMNIDYYSNVLNPTYPDGQDIEVVKFSALKKAWENAKLKSDREHVTSYIRNNSTFNGLDTFKSYNHSFKHDYSNVRLTLDYSEDFKVIRSLINQLGRNSSWLEYTKLYLSDQKINNLNSSN